MILDEDLVVTLRHHGVNVTLLDSLVKIIPPNIRLSIDGGNPTSAFGWSLDKKKSVKGGLIYISSYKDCDYQYQFSLAAGIDSNPAQAIGKTIRELFNQRFVEMRNGRIIPILKDISS